jgi:hypothetical protein
MTMSAPMIDLTSGAPAQMVALTLSMAWKYFVFAALTSFVVEAFGKSPTEPRDYGACTWRVLIVVVLLTNYSTIFGSLVNLASQLAAEVAPEALATQLGGSLVSSAQSFWSSATTPTGTTAPSLTALASGSTSSLLGDVVFKALIGMVTVIGLLANRIVLWLAGVLIALCYVLGPLALVFAIPRVSSVGTKWFEHFVSICTWPIISGALVCLVSALGVQLNGDVSQSLHSLAMSLVLLCTAIATPLLASKFVGGGISQAISHGMNTATGLAAGAKGLVSKAGHNQPDPSPKSSGEADSGQAGPTNSPGPSGSPAGVP